MMEVGMTTHEYACAFCGFGPSNAGLFARLLADDASLFDLGDGAVVLEAGGSLGGGALTGYRIGANSAGTIPAA